jgi:outer membrane protein OmpA-like peptidoglycan-associated protein
MKRKSNVRNAILMGIMGGLIATPLLAVEIITKEDLVNNVVKKEQLVRVADNAIILIDTSSSMNDKFGDTGKTLIDVENAVLKDRNSYFPDLGQNFGIYTFTGWTEHYPVQPYNRDKIAAALETVKKKGGGATPLRSGLQKLEEVLKPLSGRTAVFLFWDGEYTGDNPASLAKKIASTYDVCFYVINDSKTGTVTADAKEIASLNACSRVISIANFINHPEYVTGALFDVKVTEHVVTTTTTKIIGLKADHMNFTFNGTALADKDKAELDQVAGFMKNHPKSYAVIAGYTDDAGTKDYNEGLSRKRAEMVAGYLKEHGIDDTRLVLQWYGLTNPIVPNDTPENRAKNRRVEIAVGLGE